MCGDAAHLRTEIAIVRGRLTNVALRNARPATTTSTTASTTATTTAAAASADTTTVLLFQLFPVRVIIATNGEVPGSATPEANDNRSGSGSSSDSRLRGYCLC